MNNMKKLIATATGILSPLALALPAYAIDICPENEFDALCGQTATDFTGVISAIIQILFIIAVIVALFFLVWGGIKWIMSSGDKGKVESARNTIIGGIIGLIFVFLAYFILQLVAGLFGIDITNLELPELF
jgi:uncharacterized protein YacL